MATVTRIQRNDHVAPGYHARITVYEESPEWDNYDRWYLMPSDLLHRLYITTWDRMVDSDGDPLHSDEEDASYVRAQYDRPVVLIY